MNFKWCVGHEAVLAWMLLMKNFLVSGSCFLLLLLSFLYRGFLLISDKMHAYQKQI